PLLGIYAATARRKPCETHAGYLPDEKLSRFEAVGLFTTGSAGTIGKADVRGKLAIGFDADFTVLDRDLFTVDVEEIVDADVVMT
ncbi:amidohydrolase family protein, partial [Bacteroides intestinalis]|uniref:amidohydrolase family protein n=1 Tax=Bacteroides intestinalis TaxID=329854 RepID=UPI001EDF3658